MFGVHGTWTGVPRGGAMGVSWTVDQVAEVARIKGIVMAKVRIEVEAMVE